MPRSRLSSKAATSAAARTSSKAVSKPTAPTRKSPARKAAKPGPARPRRYWLLKSEPDCFSYADLAASPNATTSWTGVRNHQARNFLRDDMAVGDRVLFYHSSANPPAIAGTATIVRAGYPDPTAWDPMDEHHDPRSVPDRPVWYTVDVRADRAFSEPLPLPALRDVKALAAMELLRRGSRLSVQPVREGEWRAILALAGARD